MATLTVTIPDEIYAEMATLAEHLKQTPEQSLNLAMCHFLQTTTLDSALEGIARTNNTDVTLVEFPELKESYGLDIRFHPMAIEEMEILTEEEQMSVLEELIDRISAENVEMENTLDLVILENGDSQIVLSEFSFGDVVYQIGEEITVYHIAFAEEVLVDEEEESEEEEESVEH